MWGVQDSSEQVLPTKQLSSASGTITERPTHHGPGEKHGGFTLAALLWI